MNRNLIAFALIVSATFAAVAARESSAVADVATASPYIRDSDYIPPSFDIEIAPLPEEPMVVGAARRTDLRFEY